MNAGQPGRRVDPRFGYLMALTSAMVSGVAVFVSGVGVQLFPDATLYTTLKNVVVGLLLLVPLALLPGVRYELAGLDRRRWTWLGLLALVGGSVPYVLFFRGLQLTNAVTGSTLNHLQFAVVALLAATFLRERVTPVMWMALAALLLAVAVGSDLGAVRWNAGAGLVLVSTALFAAGFVLAKWLLRELSTTAVMTAKMTGGSIVLIAWAALTGRLPAIAQLNAVQWSFVIVTGLVLLLFTATTLAALAHAPVTAVMAIGTAAPVVTLALQLLAGASVRLGTADLAGLALTLAAVGTILVAARRDLLRAPPAAAAA